MRHLVYMWHILINLMNFTVNLYANLQLHYTATPLLMTIPLTNSRSYDQSFLKSILIKMSLKFHFKLHFALCARSVDYHNACQWDNRKTTYLNLPQLAGGCTFHLILYFQLMTRSSERILFISRGVPVVIFCSS